MGSSIYQRCRAAVAILGTGLLLQSGGCVSNPSELFAGLIGSVLNSVIANFIFGAFGLAV